MMRLLVSQRRAIQLLFLLVLVIGAMALSSLGREELPEPTDEYDGVTVSAHLPGATPEQVDRRIARPIHSAIKAMAGVKEVDSSANEGLFTARIRFKRGESNPSALAQEVSQRINQITDFPSGTKGPYVSRYRSRLWEDMTLLFVGDGDLARHQKWRWVEEKLRNIPGVSELVVYGDRERRVEVQLDGRKTAAVGSRIDQLAAQLQNSLAEQAAGRIDSAMDLHQLRVQTRPDSVAALAQLPVVIGPSQHPLASLATVTDTLEPPRVAMSMDSPAATGINRNDRRGWYIQLYREPGVNIEKLSADLKQMLVSVNEQLDSEGAQFEVLLVKDRSEEVKRSFASLQFAIGSGVLLVFAVLWLCVGWRNALHAALGIPFAFFASFIAMNWLGLNLNLLTLFGLVLVTGMVVDDTIVVLENILRHQELGADKVQALSRGVREIAPSVMVATGTTIAAFFPLLLMTGDLGKFLSSIPQVAIIALLASLVECFIILPVHLYGYRKSNKAPLLAGFIAASGERCASISAVIIGRPGTSLCALALLAILSLIAAGQIQFSLAKATEIRGLRVAVEFSHDTDLNSTQHYLTEATAGLRSDHPGISYIIRLSGRRQLTFQQDQQPYLGTIELLLSKELMPVDKATELAARVMDTLRQRLPASAKLSLDLDSNKPPSDSPINVRIYSSDHTSLVAASDILRTQLQRIGGVTQINDPLNDGLREKVFKVDHGMAQRYGIGAGDIARLMHTAVTGSEVGKMDLGDEMVPVYVLGQKNSSNRAQILNHLVLDDGRQLPLSQLGVFDERQSTATVKRLNDIRYLVIRGEIDPNKISAQQLQTQIAEIIQSVDWPAGSWVEQGGDLADIEESLSSMARAGVLALGLCYLLLTLLCRSYTQPFVLLSIVPLTLMGVVLGLWLSGESLSLLGIAGVIGLIGIVLNDSLVWVGFYNQHRHEYSSSLEAAVATVRTRFRPIFLTTVTTVLALLPAAISGAGVATDIARITILGLISATILLLLFFPLFVVSSERWHDKAAALLQESKPLLRQRLGFHMLGTPIRGSHKRDNDKQGINKRCSQIARGKCPRINNEIL